jgi:XTP/dITP diphosphohydrolase
MRKSSQSVHLELVLATRNRGKLEEIRRVLRGVPVDLYSLDDFPGCPEVEEDAETFKGNAVKKALSVSSYTQKPAVADDSGLVVDSLNGAPGVLSARYAGEDADDTRNVEELLARMAGAENGERGAMFVCVIALVFPDGREVKTFEGFVKGRIGRESRGSGGFGYDPVFYPSGSERTFAEMDPAEKDALSHRGMALDKLRAYLTEETGCFL